MGAQADAHTVTAVEYRPTGGGTTGDLSNDNPNGEGGTPSFAGGYRFFPDAVTYVTRVTSRNVVRVRATIQPAVAGVPVYFRAFDVDDPSGDVTIDPNGGAGRDNRGTVANPPAYDQPGSLAVTGYLGRLRRVGGNYLDEGLIVPVRTVIDAGTQTAIAEVELAASFNPGDNFRVVANTNRNRVDTLNDQNSVPTTGPIQNFPAGAASDQLSVWRRLHIERDRMQQLAFFVSDPGSLISAVGQPDVNREVVVTTNFNIAVANRYNGGSLRIATGNPQVGRRYLIVRHTTGANATVTIDLPVGTSSPTVGDLVSLTQGDFQSGEVIAVGAPANGLVVITTNRRITEVDEYLGGILRSGNRNYHIVANSSNPAGTFNDTVTILDDGATPLPVQGALMDLYQDDFSSTGDVLGNRQSGNITASGQPVGGQVTVTTDMTIAAANRFASGILRVANTNYRIVSNTAGVNAQVTVIANAQLPLVANTLFINLGNQQPALLVQPDDDTNLYDYLQVTTVRAQNRLADAYMEPEYNQLNTYSALEVLPTTHIRFSNFGIRSLADSRRGPTPQPPDYETNVFWSVYVTTAYELAFDIDGDPEPTNPCCYGVTDSEQAQITLVFAEALRDRFVTSPPLAVAAGLTLPQLKAGTTIHEIGHQLFRNTLPDDGGSHRNVCPPFFNFCPNIMYVDVGAVSAGEFYFYRDEIVKLRRLINSP